MGKYTSLARRVEEVEPQRVVEHSTANILSVNIVNIHSNRDRVIDKPPSDLPKDTLQGSPSVEMSQEGASSSKGTAEAAENRPTNLRTTNLTNLTGSASVRCLHRMSSDKCAVCNGYVRWLVADEGRMRRAQANPEAVRREFWRWRSWTSRGDLRRD